VIWVVCVMPPPLAFIVIVWFPSPTPLPTVTFMVEVPAPGFAMDIGLKLIVTPIG